MNETHFYVRSVGGIVGENRGEGARIENSYSTGLVSGRQHVGGVVGFNSGMVRNSYSVSVVIGNIDVGGIAGSGGGANTMLENVVALNPDVTGSRIGRVFATFLSAATTRNNHASTLLTLNESPFVGIGTNANGQHGLNVGYIVFGTKTFWSGLGWDFEDVWKWNPITSLPVLRNVHDEQNHYVARILTKVDVIYPIEGIKAYIGSCQTTSDIKALPFGHRVKPGYAVCIGNRDFACIYRKSVLAHGDCAVGFELWCRKVVVVFVIKKILHFNFLLQYIW